MKNISFRKRKGESERILKAFKQVFEDGTDLNMKVGDGFISYVGGILTKMDDEGTWYADKDKWIKLD